MKLRRRIQCWLFGFDAELPLQEADLNQVLDEISHPFVDGKSLKKTFHWVPLCIVYITVILIPGVRSLGLLAILFILACVSAGYFVLWQFVLKLVYAPRIRRKLRQQGYDICVECGYWLRGLAADSEKCPECGKPIERASFKP